MRRRQRGSEGEDTARGLIGGPPEWAAGEPLVGHVPPPPPPPLECETGNGAARGKTFRVHNIHERAPDGSAAARRVDGTVTRRCNAVRAR